jgi:hypothetical protein
MLVTLEVQDFHSREDANDKSSVTLRPNFLRLVVIFRALAGEYRRLFPWLAKARILLAP